MREELGAGPSSLDRIVSGAFALLDELTFFTAGEAKPAQSWHLKRGADRVARGRARSTRTSRRGSSARRSSAGRRSWRPAATPARGRRGRCASRAATTAMADGDVITVRFTP